MAFTETTMIDKEVEEALTSAGAPKELGGLLARVQHLGALLVWHRESMAAISEVVKSFESKRKKPVVPMGAVGEVCLACERRENEGHGGPGCKAKPAGILSPEQRKTLLDRAVREKILSETEAFATNGFATLVIRAPGDWFRKNSDAMTPPPEMEVQVGCVACDNGTSLLDEEQYKHTGVGPRCSPDAEAIRADAKRAAGEVPKKRGRPRKVAEAALVTEAPTPPVPVLEDLVPPPPPPPEFLPTIDL